MELHTIIQQQSYICVCFAEGQFNGIRRDNGPDTARINFLDIALIKYIKKEIFNASLTYFMFYNNSIRGVTSNCTVLHPLELRFILNLTMHL